MARGWIRLDRRLQEHALWEDKPFARGQAWVDLLMLACYENKKIPFDGRLLELQKGQLLTSIRKLSERWGWSQGKTTRFLDVLEAEQMLTKNRYANGTVLTLANYEVYQTGGAENGAPNVHGQCTDGAPTGTYKNIKQINKLTNNHEDASAHARASSSLIKLYEDNMGAVMPMTAEILADLQSRYADDVIALAIAESVRSNARSIRYVEKVLQSWEAQGVRNAADAKRVIERFAETAKEKGKGVPSPKQTRFQNYPQEYGMSDFERAAMQKRLEDLT